MSGQYRAYRDHAKHRQLYERGTFPVFGRCGVLGYRQCTITCEHSFCGQSSRVTSSSVRALLPWICRYTGTRVPHLLPNWFHQSPGCYTTRDREDGWMDDVVMTAPVTKAPAPPYHGLLGRRAWDVGIPSSIWLGRLGRQAKRIPRLSAADSRLPTSGQVQV
jgi:hypothetical protein